MRTGGKSDRAAGLSRDGEGQGGMATRVQGRRTIRSRLPEQAANSALLAGEGKHCVKQALLLRIVLVSVVIGTDHDVFVVEQARRDGDVRRRARTGKLGSRLHSARARRTDFIHGCKLGARAA